MADTIQPHEAKDILLKYIIDKTKQLSANQYLTSKNIVFDVFPDEKEELIYLLLDDMMDVDPPLFSTRVNSRVLEHFSVYFRANAVAEVYQAAGGFTRKYEALQAEKAKQERNELLDEQIRNDNLKLNALNKRFLVINAILALATLLWTIFWSIKTNK